MKFEPVLVNQEYQDPVLLIQIPQKAETIIFDLGYCFRLKIKDIQKISRIFISHTHIDHFAGFDHILRLSLDMEKTIAIYGPEGIIQNVEGKLSGYTWNLAEGVHLSFDVYEILPDAIFRKEFIGTKGYKNPEPPEKIEFNSEQPICKTEDYSVEAAHLNHKMPVLGFRINAAPSFNADVAKIKSMGLSPGKWVADVKAAAAGEGASPEDMIDTGAGLFKAGELAVNIIKSSPGTIIAYSVDTIFDKNTAKSLKRLAKDADYYFCECAYLTSEKSLARENHHLTAKQAATVALESEVKKLIPFHFSRRYEGNYDKLYEEAKSVFPHIAQAQKYDHS